MRGGDGWERCWTGCDDGFVDEYDEDPVNNDPGDERPCDECDGAGGYHVCPNAGRHPVPEVRP